MEKLASDLLLKSFSLWQQVLRGVRRVCDGKKTRSKMKRLLASAVTGSGYRIRVFKSLREHGLFAAIFVGWGEPSCQLADQFLCFNQQILISGNVCSLAVLQFNNILWFAHALWIFKGFFFSLRGLLRLFISTLLFAPLLQRYTKPWGFGNHR